MTIESRRKGYPLADFLWECGIPWAICKPPRRLNCQINLVNSHLSYMKWKEIFLGWFSAKIRTCFLIISILYRSKKRVGLHTYTHLRLVVGLNKEHKKCLILWLVYVSNLAFGRHKFLIELSYINLVLCCYVYAFCLRTSKDPSVGEFDESIN